MKKFYVLLLAISANTIFSQEIIFSENMGIPPTNPAQTPIASHTFENGSPIQFSGDAVVVLPNNPDIAMPSSGYAGASGGGAVALFATEKIFEISGIDTSNHENIVLTFGQLKGNGTNSNTLTIEVSEDGTNWTPLSYTGVAGSSTWNLITTSGDIPSTQDLIIRFKNPAATNSAFRIDDVTLTGSTLSVKQNAIAGLKVYPNPVSNGTLFIETTANAEKTISIYDVLGKNVLNTSTTENSVNVSSLRAGIYMVNITEEGKTATRKLVIK
jgi:hypothetical protein